VGAINGQWIESEIDVDLTFTAQTLNQHMDFEKLEFEKYKGKRSVVGITIEYVGHVGDH
jgi:hypothetical protein